MEGTRAGGKRCKGANAAVPRAKVQMWITKTKIRVAGGGLRWRVAGLMQAFGFPLPSVLRHLSSHHTPMPLVPGLLSPYDAVRGFVYLTRLVSKIRLHAAGQLHADFVNNLGKAFDERCCQYLGIKYDDLRIWVLQHPTTTQDEVLAWAEAKGRKLSTNDIEIWNGFMTKRGWRDEANEVLVRRLKENGLPADAGVDTMFDYIEVDEGRPARKAAL